MVISRGASTCGLTGVQCLQCGKRREDHNVVCVCLRQQNLEEVFLQSGSLAIACFFICSPLGHSLLLHFSAVLLATSCFFLEILL
jgi:hypothetical protein